MSDPQKSSFSPESDVFSDRSTSTWSTEDRAGVIDGAEGATDMASTFAGQPLNQSSNTSSTSNSSNSGQGGQSSDGGGGGGGSSSMLSGAKESVSQVTEQAGAALGSVKEKASGMTDQATNTVDTGMDKAATGLDSLAGTLRDRGESMGGGSVGSIASTAADKLESGAQILREKDTDQMVSDLEALVRRKPVESVLVAAGIGFVLSKIVR